MKYVIVHRHGEQYLQIALEVPFWVNDPVHATLFESFVEAEKALRKYSKGSKAGYPWIGLEKGVFIGHLKVHLDCLITEDTIDSWN